MPVGGKKSSAIVTKGGGIIKVYEVTSAGVGVGGASWDDLGYVEETTLKDETTQSPYQDETGNTVAREDDVRSVIFSGLLMQTNKALADFLAKGCRGKYFAVYYYAGVVDGKHQEYFMGIGKIKPLLELTSKRKRPPFEIEILENESSLSFGIAGIAMPSDAKASAATIAAGDYWESVETAVA